MSLNANGNDRQPPHSNAVIGILGSYGAGGQTCLSSLLENTSFSFRLGGRNCKKGIEAAARLNGRGYYAQVDALDENSVLAFAEGCDLLINCAGPSRLILDTVGKAACRAGCHYIDLAGDEVVFDRLAPMHDGLREKNQVFILSAGIFPGLSGLFAAYWAEKEFDSVHSMRMSFINCGESMSQTAAYDIVYSLKDGYGQGMVCLKDGKIVKSSEGPHFTDVRFARDKLLLYPSFNHEFQHVAERYAIDNAKLYVFMPPATMQTLFQIRSDESWQTEEQTAASVQKLVRASETDCQATAPHTCYMLSMEGESSGEPKTLEATLAWQGSSVQLIGEIVAITARQILAGLLSGGRHLLCSGMDGNHFIQQLCAAQNGPEMTWHAETLDSGVI